MNLAAVKGLFVCCLKCLLLLHVGIVTIQVKVIDQHFQVILIILLNKRGFRQKFLDETLVRDHSSESYRAVLSRDTVYYAVQGGLTFNSE